MKKTYKPKPCIVCQEAFLPTAASNKVCSPECALAMNSAPNEETGCWQKLNGGYGFTAFRGMRDNSHRFAWRLFNGSIPDDMVVRHKCDSPGCFNPDHLELGTQLDNINDTVERNRTSAGEKNASAKFTNAEILEIYHSTDPVEDIAARVGLHPYRVRHIKDGTYWSKVTGHQRPSGGA